MMKRSLRLLIAGAAAASLAITTPALAQLHKVQGIVVHNENGRLTIKTPHGDQTISIAPDARIRSVSGALGGQKEVVPSTALLPGLPIVMEVDNSSGHMVAKDIEYKAKDYKTAAQISAGTQETRRREAELRNAYSKMGNWDIRAEENVYFKTGSAVISPAEKQKLLHVAGEAAKVKGYVISVLGYADPTGNAKANERLSNRRAQAVINYLKQSGKVLPGKVLGASAMGEMNIPTDAPDTKAAYQSARRVTVRVLQSAAHLNK